MKVYSFWALRFAHCEQCCHSATIWLWSKIFEHKPSNATRAPTITKPSLLNERSNISWIMQSRPDYGCLFSDYLYVCIGTYTCTIFYWESKRVVAYQTDKTQREWARERERERDWAKKECIVCCVWYSCTYFNLGFWTKYRRIQATPNQHTPHNPTLLWLLALVVAFTLSSHRRPSVFH